MVFFGRDHRKKSGVDAFLPLFTQGSAERERKYFERVRCGDPQSTKDNMISRDVTIRNNVGLHARPATFFIQKANSYRSAIWVEKEDRRVNAKSLLGVLSLGIVKGMTITLIADGADEADALEGLAALIDSGFGE